MRPGSTSLIVSQKPVISHEIEGNRNTFTFSGQWRSLNIAEKEQEFEDFFASLIKNQKINFIFASDFKADMTGAWLIGQFIYKIKALNYPIEGAIPETIDRYIHPEFQIHSLTPLTGINSFLIGLGKNSIALWELTLSLFTFLGEVIVNFYSNMRSHQGIRWTSVVHHLDVVGLQAVPLISLISILVGAVLGYQGINQLTRFGAAVYTVDFLAISLLREISVLITSIVIAGRSGSAFTAQIGTMVLNQEIDAIRMLGLSPIRALIIPRIIAMVIALPLLVVLAMIMGSIGGMVICDFMIDLSPGQFFDLFQQAVSNSTFWVGFSKAPLFALIISIIGCYRGMQVKGSAESVGAMTTQSVVESIFLVIVCDGLISIFFSMLDL